MSRAVCSSDGLPLDCTWGLGVSGWAFPEVGMTSGRETGVGPAGDDASASGEVSGALAGAGGCRAVVGLAGNDVMLVLVVTGSEVGVADDAGAVALGP